MNELDRDDIEVIRLVLFEAYPPTNPSVLLKAARNWYLDHGDDAVFRTIVDRVREVSRIKPNDVDDYSEARRLFLASMEETKDTDAKTRRAREWGVTAC